MKTRKPKTAEDSPTADADLEKVSLDTLYQTLGSSPKGLSSSDAKARLETYGRNELVNKEVSNLERLLRFFWGPIAWMIEVAALLSLLMGHWADLTIILTLLFYNAISGFWQERKASDALAALKAGMAPKATALRDGKIVGIDAAEVVPGDVLRIKLGEVVPADVRFIEGDYISIDQAALTGESLPVNKKIGDEGYSGSIAKKGEMHAMVIGTGNNTFFGRTANLVASAGGGASNSQKATTQIGNFLIITSVILCAILVGFELYQDIVVQAHWVWSDIGVIARMVLVLLIASIPVAMPTVITVNNSLGAQELAKKKAIVSRLEAIEELAGVDILCSDKTGTLTKNILTLGDPTLFKAASEDELILAGALASEVGSEDAMDKAVSGGLKETKDFDSYKVTKFIPFDPVGKRSEGHATDAQGKALQFTKGAPQVIVEICKLDTETEAKANKTVADLAAVGMRALGIAKSEDDGKTWSFLGILSLLDPPRDDSKATIEEAKTHGLSVKMVTGDDVAIGSQISGQLGMGTHLIAAADMFTKDMDMDRLSDTVGACVEKADGFGRVFPEHKYGIVKALQERNHVVAMTGDGVNDAPALKQADCGIAVSGATDAARAAAALILTAPGLSTVIDAIEESRRIFERILNYIMFRVAMTLDIMFVVVLSTLFFNFSPLTAVMIILIALLDDVPIMTIAYDNTVLSKGPVRWQMKRLLFVSGFMGLMAIMQSFGLLLIGMEWLSNPDWQSWIHLTKDQLQTVIFLQIVAGGHLLLFVMRSRSTLFTRPWPAKPLFIAIVGTQIIAVLICGFGWFVPAIPWTIIGLVWVYMLVWMLVLDVVKLALYRKINADEQPHPSW
ncbi:MULTISPECIES: plasma-membrane proton-efflux P-type ATPase [unclassified Lentimonas]|uniref:plasma-membrane proton-efflux P-type ATPase n=1 Tax=unclassified Lentimonas TaxID=2630993 RepID=UPI00132CB2CA|nr:MULTISPECIES: plasma-membrane proton-efflux P-type ATPase [unclassified Lentimonas]CAA6676934.1 Lead, cadmium, zinc and mercury transporting ATPase (EC (EC; Copper-translocating P-type ATPase (EC [Lentimonas sp. CC4]CAA6686740.1 Lead, cadmium, zinc and mercury transporting ATPase (EC (EC; Copper-translocating P-type ATPase (EC [Lentimonas sp. CC6]CAA7075683.1 Lead, cadmium, zinc and mercury transporting ATPase (EC (EC; Copper-translocating P-type ATPase (EC [Lentimonas sp. CC4]CAA7168159.1 L